jgi:hypothetical protein
MLTRRVAKGKRSDDYVKTTHAATALLNDIAEASYQAIGLTKKKKPAEDNMSQKGDKDRNSVKQTSDDYYDDRLSRDSQLDDNLKSLVSSRPASATFGHLSTDLDTVSGEDDDTHIEDEFYDETTGNGEGDKTVDAPLSIDKSDKLADTLTPEEMGAMMGDWQDSDIPSPDQGPHKRQASSSPGQGASDASLLSVDVPVRHDPKRIAMAERQVIKVVKSSPLLTGEDGNRIQDQLADIPVLRQQLTTALQDIANLKIAMDEQFDTLSRTATAVGSHGTAIDNLHNQSEMFRQKLVDMEVRTDNTCADMVKVKQVAQKSEVLAKKSMEVAQACSEEMKSLEKRMAALRKIQDDMVLSVSQIRGRPAQQQAAAPIRGDELSENSIFLAGIPSIRNRLKMPPLSDPVFVVSCFLRELEIYSGMDSIVIADNAAQTRSEARAVIIHMRSHFHKRGAMGTLKRELARQKMADTAVRDCFPTAVMDTVKRYIRFAMKMKTAGTIDKFQIINRRGQPVLQTGKRAGNFADYQGNIDEEEPAREMEQETDDGPWTTVGKKGKKLPAPPTGVTQQKTADSQQTSEGATARQSTWAQMTEEDYPELPQKGTATQQRQAQQAAARDNQRQRQLNDINIKLQQLSATPPAVASSQDQRPLGARNKTITRNNSRGSSKNHSRRTSRERADSGHRNNNNQRNKDSTSPPPFQSYFKARSYNNSEETGTIPKSRSSDTQRLVHEQHHRKR